MTQSIVQLENPRIAVHLRVNAAARRFTLRLDPTGAGAVLTLPRGVPLAEARMFLLRQSDWLARAMERHPGRVVVGDGTRLPVAGREVEVVLTPGPRRPPVLIDERLVVAGHGAPGPRIAAWLKERARAELVPAAQRHAKRLLQTPKQITLRDTRSRWGSCTSAGNLSFSWRLAMVPPGVLDYVAAHEAAHLVEMSHAPRFWEVVQRLLPDYHRHRAWLKREGRTLHAFHFGAE